MGPFECPRALAPGQPGGFRRWHPCCRRCLLKDCERWFLPPWPQARYCSPACREAAEHWRSWHAGQTYQSHHRKARNAAENRPDAIASVQRQRSALAEPAAPTLPSRAGFAGDRSPDHVRFDTDYPRRHPERRPAPSRNSPENLAVCRAADLGATSCSCPRPVLPINISVPAHAARHYGEFASGKPDSGADAGVASLAVTSVIVDHRQATSVMSPRIEHAILEE